MKKIVILLIDIILLSVVLFVYVYAHSGRTDSNGGHYDRQHGGYHYHHGYPAHSHENGVCLYDYDSKTEYSFNNGNINNSNSDKNILSTSDSDSDDTPTKQQKTKVEIPVWKNIVGIVFGALIYSPLILSFLFFIYYRIILPILKYAKKKYK